MSERGIDASADATTRPVVNLLHDILSFPLPADAQEEAQRLADSFPMPPQHVIDQLAVLFTLARALNRVRADPVAQHPKAPAGERADTKWLTIDQAAAHIHASESWLYRRALEFGGVKGAKWLFTRHGLDAALQSRAEAAPAPVVRRRVSRRS